VRVRAGRGLVAYNPGILFLRDTPDDLVNVMFEVFREAARLNLRAHGAPMRDTDVIL
jgi:hypothetical protein